MKFRYFILAVILFAIEFCIGSYMHDDIVRPYIGDMLVTILIYCLVKSVVNTPVMKTAFWVLIYCYVVEVSQYFHLIVHLGWQNYRWANFLLGSYFTWIDMLCYTIGALIILAIEFTPLYFKKKNV